MQCVTMAVFMPKETRMGNCSLHMAKFLSSPVSEVLDGSWRAVGLQPTESNQRGGFWYYQMMTTIVIAAIVIGIAVRLMNMVERLTYYLVKCNISLTHLHMKLWVLEGAEKFQGLAFFSNYCNQEIPQRYIQRLEINQSSWAIQCFISWMIPGLVKMTIVLTTGSLLFLIFLPSLW